ncbi:glycine zipper domain-containing protein [Nonomuraea angiospora]|uniref:WXG100 family type VII secretion target n=1 Tax=Nonomuraea angiospora TaxID=46172 RepID=A0ABR9MC67_9ACTN|nr:glycine zipper domain-containing protein [Nonomuraea angiospora]MBE1590220.1 hypothetical protein [Nonomuraea angiospora]
MAEYQAAIRGQIGSLEFEGATLDLLRDTLAKNKPQLIGQAAAEFLEAKVRLDNLVDVIDKHLRELDKHWTAGEDAKTVKTQLRRLREAAADISTTISDQPVDPKNPPKNPHGVAPALIVHARTLSAAKGDVPDNPGSDIDFGEAAVTGGVAGAAIGSFFGGVGAVPGVVIGAGVGVLVGGITRFISDLPFANLWGDSKEEKDMKKAAEAIKLLSQDTKLNNDVFPAELRTDIPQFMTLAPNVPTGPFGGKTGIGGNIPAGLNQAYDPTAGFDGLNQDGLQDLSRHQIPGIDMNNPTSTFPDGGTVGTVGTGIGNGQNGNGGNGQNGAGNVPGLTDPSNALNANANVNPNLNGSQSPNAGNPTTTLAGMPDPSLSGPSTSLPTTGIGSPHSGYTTGGSSFGGGGGQASGAGNNVSAAALRGLGGGPSAVSAVPPSGGRGAQERGEMERTTYLLEDEDLFRSDVTTTNHTIKGDSKGKA